MKKSRAEITNGCRFSIRELACVVLTIVVPGFISRPAFAANDYLDTTFGSGGIVKTVVGKNSGVADNVIQPDGKIVATGTSAYYRDESTDFDYAIVRYHQDGRLDSSFGSGGKVVDRFGPGTSFANSVLLQSDGKIVVSGFYRKVAGTDQAQGFALARYNANGSLDESFGEDGKIITPVGIALSASLDSALLRDGKILLAGYAHGQPNPVIHTPNTEFAFVRYNPDGSLDNDFGNDGKVLLSVWSDNESAASVCIQRDGRIVAAGSTNRENNGQSSPVFATVRLLGNGSLDTTFGKNGRVITSFGDKYARASAVALQGDGKIVAAGVYETATRNADFALARYNSDGSLDSSFGTQGKVVTAFGARNDFIYDVAIASNGKIVAVGDAGVSNQAPQTMAVARYNRDGSLDNTFGDGGKISTQAGDSASGVSRAKTVALQNDGKIIAGGESYSDNGDRPFTLVRYNSSLGLPIIDVNNAPLKKEGASTQAGAARFVITLPAPAAEPVTFQYTTVNGTASAGEDYIAKSGALTFAPGEITKYLTVGFVGDDVAEAHEKFFLDIKSPVNATIVDSRGTAYIENDDGARITIDNAPPVMEGSLGQTTAQQFVVKLSAASTKTITVDWSTINGTAGPTDYITASGRLTFAPGETQKTITVQVKHDRLVEPNENYKVNLSRPTFAVIADSQAIAYILNDDSAPQSAVQNVPSE